MKNSKNKDIDMCCKFISFVFPDEDTCTEKEIDEELRKKNISLSTAFTKIKQSLDCQAQSQSAQEALITAQTQYKSILSRISESVVPAAINVRETIIDLIKQRFSGTQQAAYFHKLEQTTNENDLKSMLEDLQRLDTFKANQNGSGT
jgi:hypothetical protein